MPDEISNNKDVGFQAYCAAGLNEVLAGVASTEKILLKMS